MHKPKCCLSLLSLITLLHIPQALANPLPCGCDAPTVSELFDSSTLPDTASTNSQQSSSSLSTIDPVMQISDGQVQAPYHGRPVASVSSTSTSSVVTAMPAGLLGHRPLPQPLPASVIPLSLYTTSTTVISTVASSSPSPTVTVTATSVPAATTPTIIATSAPQAAISSVMVTPTSVVSTTVPDTLLTSLTTSAIQSPTQPIQTNTIGSLHTSLETPGLLSTLPFVTSVATGTTPLSLISSIYVTPTASISATTINVDDIFRAIATDAPPAQISQRSDHPVPRLNIVAQQKKLETNKFYANLFLGDQASQAYTFPYALGWVNGRAEGNVSSWGLSIAHSERSQVAYGPVNQLTGAASYYTNPIGIQSVILSAAQLGEGTNLTTDSLSGFSVNANLVAAGANVPTISFPLVQGMGFITAIYYGATPLIDSTVGIQNITYSGAVADSVAHKYRLQLADGNTWLIYIVASSSDYAVNSFTLLAGVRVQGASGFSGYIQVAKLPVNAANSSAIEAAYDTAAGAYPVSASIAGEATDSAGSYSLTWTKGGDTNKTLLMFALPHHVQSFASATAAQVTAIELMTTVKGLATAISADYWTLLEPELPISMAFAPWNASSQQSSSDVSAEAQALINAAATLELAQDVHAQSDLNSMYYSGKALAKFAAIVYAAHDIAKNATLALTGLQELESAFNVFVNNTQVYPLVYESAWGGVVSTASYVTGDSGEDFGNTYYNDHHFHYGYFVYAAAVIGYLDPTWLTSNNKAWVNMLVRDYANPVETDPYFPFSRSFDWYHGHSWAQGLFESADGKDQESSSEDTMASYGLKMWGKIIGDTAMEARGNLMLAVQARSLANYYLYTSDNTVEPAEFIPNKAAGIIFENKIDHTTYFGTAIEDIEGIHMIPIMPFSSLTRRQAFVVEEWNTYFLAYSSTVTSGWRGILMANLALIDPKTSFNFFANYSGTFLPGMLDGGASQTWYLAYSAALGGSVSTAKRDVEEQSSTMLRAFGKISMRSVWDWLRQPRQTLKGGRAA